MPVGIPGLTGLLAERLSGNNKERLLISGFGLSVLDKSE